MKTTVLCDFDGTITLRDTCELTLCRFAIGDWEKFDCMMDECQISLEECLTEQFKLVHASPAEILEYLDIMMRDRNGYGNLVTELKKLDCDMHIVSAGLDFVIQHHLRKIGHAEHVSVICGKTTFDGFLHFHFPPKKDPRAADFKQDQVLMHKRMGETVYHIGDGTSDYNAARSCDHCFAVRDSRLEKLCIKEGIEYDPFDDFDELGSIIDELIHK